MRIKNPKYTTHIIIGIVIICILTVLGIVMLQVNKHTHTFGEWELFKESSCSEYGIERRFCACGEMQEKKNDRIDHTEGEWIVYTEANEKVLFCSVCGKRLKVETLESHTHSYGEWVTTVEPTCSEGGVMTRTCRCGAKEEKAISTGNHSFGDWAVERESTCTEKGIMSRYCDCGAKDKKEIPLTDHTYGEWTVTKEAECGIYGAKERVCSCGAKEEQKIHALEHSFSSWTVTKNPSCTTLGKEKRTCYYCGISESRDTSALGHGNTYSQINGSYVNIYCERCNTVLESHLMEHSKGLNIDGTSLLGIGTCQDTVVVIPSGITTIDTRAFMNSTIKVVILPNTVSVISDRAFSNCHELGAIYIDCSVTEISFNAFQFSYNLSSIHYNGTIDQWNSISKDPDWDYGMGEYTIYCTDGNIEK